MRKRQNVHSVDDRTVADYGAQWAHFTASPGHYGSVDMLHDIVEPLYPLGEIRGARVAEVGSGTGRIVNMLLDAGAAHVIALEPSEAQKVLRRNTADRSDRITYIRVKGDRLPLDQQLDLVLAIGVLHHIIDPKPTVRRMFQALKPGGHIMVWVYGHEGNETYLRIVLPLREVTKRLPDGLLRVVSQVLTCALVPYIWLCRFLPLPMRAYMRNLLAKYTYHILYLTVFDQLNPAYAKYYTGEEAERLLTESGFVGVRRHHRHGYSWTVVGRKPEEGGVSDPI